MVDNRNPQFTSNYILGYQGVHCASGIVPWNLWPSDWISVYRLPSFSSCQLNGWCYFPSWLRKPSRWPITVHSSGQATNLTTQQTQPTPLQLIFSLIWQDIWSITLRVKMVKPCTQIFCIQHYEHMLPCLKARKLKRQKCCQSVKF